MATWTVSTYYKKSCEEHEQWTKDGMTIVRKNGFRWGKFTVETSDDNPPEFEFDYVPGGDGKKDSIDMYNCCANNIESVELDMLDDGCWSDVDYPDDMDEDEQERLDEIWEEDAYSGWEEDGWMQDDTECWIWGPILIEDDNGNRVKIIVADEDGNAVEFEDK